ncbi:DUF6787 family protein [Flavobacterium sp.]|uniref:DUF6787 family protein n=1 Tax=Flavobacterium sp. TaxID=239 RepID=UPI0026360AAA|nr:DUF6787 family protein [Flavobacterium sp.]MDG2433735.1 diacylglyceryl transferase [Flavobacterium sp.]
MKKLKKRWGIESNLQLAIIFIVFAITGSTSAWISKPVCLWLGITAADFGSWFILIRLLIIFPLYQVFLVAIGTLFGQFTFFWKFEKKMLKSMGLGFLFKEK